MNRISDEELVKQLRERASFASREKTGTAYADARYFNTAADRLSAPSPRVKTPASLSMKDGVVMAAFNTDEEAQEFFDALSAIEVSASPRVVTDEVDGGWLIHKAGRGWYRPNAQGYTNDTAQAGRYSHEDALSYSHPNGWDGPRDGITIKHESELQSPRTARREATPSAGDLGWVSGEDMIGAYYADE